MQTAQRSPLSSLPHFFCIGIQLLYNVVLVSAVQQCESATCTHTSPPSWASLPPSVPPLWGITEHQAELPALHGRFPLAVYFTHGSVNMSVLPSVLLSLKENVTDAQMVALRWAVWGPWGRRPARRCPHLTAGVGLECNPNPHPLHHALCFSKWAHCSSFVVLLYENGIWFSSFDRGWNRGPVRSGDSFSLTQQVWDPGAYSWLGDCVMCEMTSLLHGVVVL